MHIFKTILAVVLLAISIQPIFALDLNGAWNCNDGGKYYLRQLDNTTLWWYGEATPTSPNFSNVAYGTISGNTLNLKWADVPKGTTMSSGSLTLNVVSNNELQAIQKTGGFSGSDWTRVPCPDGRMPCYGQNCCAEGYSCSKNGSCTKIICPHGQHSCADFCCPANWSCSSDGCIPPTPKCITPCPTGEICCNGHGCQKIETCT